MSPERARVALIEDDKKYAERLSVHLNAQHHTVTIYESKLAIEWAIQLGELAAKSFQVMIVKPRLAPASQRDFDATQVMELVKLDAKRRMVAPPYFIGNTADPYGVGGANENNFRRSDLASLAELVKNAPDNAGQSISLGSGFSR